MQLFLQGNPYSQACLSLPTSPSWLHTYLPQPHRLKPGVTGPVEGSYSHTLECETPQAPRGAEDPA